MAIDFFFVLILSSGNTSSVAHTDDYDNINCVLQGDKQFILVDPNIHKDVASEVRLFDQSIHLKIFFI